MESLPDIRVAKDLVTEHIMKLCDDPEYLLGIDIHKVITEIE